MQSPLFSSLHRTTPNSYSAGAATRASHPGWLRPQLQPSYKLLLQPSHKLQLQLCCCCRAVADLLPGGCHLLLAGHAAEAHLLGQQRLVVADVALPHRHLGVGRLSFVACKLFYLYT